MRLTPSAFGPLGVAALALAGCATSVSASGEGTDAEATSTATAVVVVEGTSANDGDHAQAIARFVRARGGAVDDDALRMVGAAVDLPALGSCSAVVSHPFASTRTVSLVDVGGVSLLAGDAIVPLAPRQLPDVADMVSGVVYSARVESPTLRGAYVLRVEGASDSAIPAFTIGAFSPGAPSDVKVAGEDGRAGAVAIATSAPVDLAWSALEEAGDDLIYVDVSAATSAPSVRCVFGDTGRAAIPASAFGAIEDGAIAVHRLHREPFRVKGVDPGEARFDFARVIAFVRR